MSQSMRFSAIIEFFFRTIGTPPGEHIRGFKDRISEFERGIGKQKEGAEETSSKMRRLALDFRLMTSALRYLTQELGIQDTFWGRTARSLSIFSSMGTAAISAMNAMNRIAAELGANTVYVYGIVAAFIAFNETFDRVSGINQYKQTIKDLTENLKDLQATFRDVKIEQAGFSITSAALALEQARLDDALIQGNITQEIYDERTTALDANLKNLNVSISRNRLEAAYWGREQAVATDQVEDMNLAIERQIQERNRLMWEVIPRAFGGDPWAKIGLAEASARGIAATLRGEMGAGRGPGTVIISMDGAQIFGSEGVAEALEAGGRRVLEWLRTR